MLLISYDIKDNKLRTKFNKFITRYGHRLQYSLYEIQNSDRILNIIMCEIETNFKEQFSETDSIMIFKFRKDEIIAKYGYAKHQDDAIILLL
ncbi:CRISPR-associated endonuclease Cas2 [Clostridium sp.]|uniref:CRISPR-associated endonuclease Cas2 n=1 Tax=Clostridium sp. TaxID=1506 RepID=UPI0029027126|nr:CRISPR-associated endonuclease Cas2 [Clostridium sp.]MDU2156352.1 CRISPR-associated endonuclease Cas2 [Clostridium sp.]